MREQELLGKETLTPEEAMELGELVEVWSSGATDRCSVKGAVGSRKSDNLAKAPDRGPDYWNDDFKAHVWADKNFCGNCKHRLTHAMAVKITTVCFGLTFEARE